MGAIKRLKETEKAVVTTLYICFSVAYYWKKFVVFEFIVLVLLDDLPGYPVKLDPKMLRVLLGRKINTIIYDISLFQIIYIRMSKS